MFSYQGERTIIKVLLSLMALKIKKAFFAVSVLVSKFKVIFFRKRWWRTLRCVWILVHSTHDTPNLQGKQELPPVPQKSGFESRLAWFFFQSFFRNCISCFVNCDDILCVYFSYNYFYKGMIHLEGRRWALNKNYSDCLRLILRAWVLWIPSKILTSGTLIWSRR